MIVFRLAKEAYAKDLSGAGAEKSGGRWNSKGNAMLYTSESRALCMLEVAVHIPLHLIPSDYWLVTLEIPGTIPVLEINPKNLPPDWTAIPPANSTQETGDHFLHDAKYGLMKVPSVVVPGDFNWLVNPLHPMVKKVKIIATEPFKFDGRLFKK
jgi:RES domain-containing protein